jgi:hypothetical protein
MTSEPITGIPDERYDLVSVLYHVSQGGETTTQYLRDAEEAGDQELIDFFQQVLDSYRQLAQGSWRLLAARLA